MFKIFDSKPDHPLFDVAEAKRLLVAMKRDDYFKALDEIATWLETIKDTEGFKPEVRNEIIMLLDEEGQPFYSELLLLYLGEPHLQDFEGMQLWRELHGFMKTLFESYAICIGEYQKLEKPPTQFTERLPVICVRMMRALAEQIKIELMHYVDIEQPAWERLVYCYKFAADHQFAETLVFAYPRQALHISPQRELLRAMMLDISSPATLAQDQIEVCFRIITRMVSYFDFKEAPTADCPYWIDLDKPREPQHATSDLKAKLTMRFFGASRAVPKITEIINQHELELIQQEQRFGTELTPAGKLTVLKHVQDHWGNDHIERHQARRKINTAIEVVHSFATINKLVTRMDIDNAVNISEEDAAILKERSSINLVATEETVDFTAEKWVVSEASLSELSGIIPKSAGNWVKIGDLCGIKAENSPLWWVGTINRLHTGANGALHFGIEMLAKKPLSVWLRTLGKGAEKVSAWESSSGSFAYDYISVILLPDINNSYVNATMLMASGNYSKDAIYEVMLGEKSREIKLAGLLHEGEDYEQVNFNWLGVEHN